MRFLQNCVAGTSLLASLVNGQALDLLNLTSALGLTLSVDVTANLSGLLAGLGPASEDDPRWLAWQAPGPDDVRSPCPGLNSLANHGFINRDGRNLTIANLLVGSAEGLNIGADFTIVVGALGLLSSKYPLLGSFNLDDLDQHDFPIEHDGSLSRQDAYYGNDYSFNDSKWQQVLSYYDGLNATNTTQASQARYHRINESLTNNPDVVYGLKEFILSSGETGLYVQTMGNPINNSAPIAYIKSLFEDEKLPFELGWRPSSEPINLLTLGGYVLELYLANPDKVAEGLTFTTDSYADLFEILFGGTEVVGNLTTALTTGLVSLLEVL